MTQENQQANHDRHTPDRHTGGCLCGAVRFHVKGKLKPIDACHCKQCRRWSGHVWASTGSKLGDLTITKGEDQLAWYISSEFARRGFCKTCGSSLFWHADRAEKWKHNIAIGAGCMDEPTGLSLTKHIFCAYKGDYYELADGLPQEDTETE